MYAITLGKQIGPLQTNCTSMTVQTHTTKKHLKQKQCVRGPGPGWPHLGKTSETSGVLSFCGFMGLRLVWGCTKSLDVLSKCLCVSVTHIEILKKNVCSEGNR